MIKTRSSRGLVALGFALALVAGACGSSSATTNPLGGLPGGVPGGGGGGGSGGGTSLTAGLSSGLDQLNSYKFTWTYSGSSTGTQASPGESGSFATTGVVVNKPAKAIFVDSFGIQHIQIGTQSWTSADSGVTWMVDSSPTDLSSMLPNKYYASMFDTNATGFKAAGDESKNGVQCVHFKGDTSLGALYQGISGVSASFQADLWVAKDGNYPVSGVYGITASSGGQGGAFGYSFDITNINDSSNQVSAPTNVVAVPS
jgi:hypothetical protein